MVKDKRRRVYIVDTSAWVSLDGDPMSNRILSLLEGLMQKRRIRSPKQVFGELIRANEYTAWVKTNRRRLTYPSRMSSEYAENAGLVQHSFPGMGKALGTKERADPWVIAAALTENANGTECWVVTTENSNRRPNRKIPGACDKLGIRRTTLRGVVELEEADDDEHEEAAE